MADKNFFDLLKDKMAALRPSEKHRDDDWGALSERLNAALPQQPQGKRRAIVIPLVLLAALLSSNAMWWQSSRSDQASLTRLEAQMGDLKASITALGAAPAGSIQYKVLHDTLWRTVYVRSNDIKYEQSVYSEKSGIAISKASLKDSFHVSGVTTFPSMLDSDYANNTPAEKPSNIISDEKKFQVESDSTLGISDLAGAENPAVALLDTAMSASRFPENQTPQKEVEKKPIKPFSEKLADALHPKFFKVGVNVGWLNANSKGLMHEGGFSYNLRGEIGFSRHWSVMANLGKGQLHYKAHTPEAILGAPDFPMLPSMEHHYTEMDVTGQKILQFGLGLRYTFSQPGRPRPFLGLGWGGQTIMPFSVEYEIQHESTGAIQKGVYEVTARTQMRNMLGLSTGIEMPISSRFDLTLEGFYQRAWKKPSGVAPDLIGIQAGMNWLF